MQRAIEELEKALGHLERAIEAESLLQPYQDNPYPCLILGRAIRAIKSIPGRLKCERARQKQEKEE